MTNSYRLTPDQQTVVEQVRRVAEDQPAPRAAVVDRGYSFPQEAVAALARAGLLGLTIPQEHGGMGEGLRTVCAVVEEIAQRCASTAMIYMMHLCGVACYAARPDRAIGKLRAAAAGKHLSTLAWSEVGSGSDFWAPVSREVPENGKVLLSSRKSFVTSAGHADGYVISTGWSERVAPTQSTLYLVRRDDAGVNVAGP